MSFPYADRPMWLYSRSSDKHLKVLFRQMQNLLDEANRREYTVAGTSQDMGSGKSMARMGLKQMIRAVKGGLAQAVLVQDLTRLSHDPAILMKILEFLNYVIDHSAQATQYVKSAECLSLEAMRLTNELNRKMNDPNISSDYLLELIKRCAQEKYNALQNQSVGWQNELLKKELESRSPSESLDVQLFQKVVYKVLIAYDTTVTLQLINRKIF